MTLFHHFANSQKGYNHIKANKVCQDYSGSFSDGNGVYIVVVADGHGSDNYPRTDKGSQYAVESALTAVQQFVATAAGDNIDIAAEYKPYMEQLVKNILSLWHDAVEKDVADQPFTEEELAKVSEKYKKKYLSGSSNGKAYGTTLIVVCATPSYWFGLQIGDGKCVAFSRQGDVSEPIPWDESCQSNVTTSICDSNAIEEFRFFCSKDLPLAIFIGCDGIDDSYASKEELYALYRSVLTIFAEHDENVGKSEVKEFLPTLSKKGSGDDVSIAGLVDTCISSDIVGLIKAQGEYATAQMVHEKAKKNIIAVKERLDYVIEAIKKAKTTYETAQQKEADVKIELEEAHSTIKVSAENLQAAETRLHALIVKPDKSSELEETTAESSDILTQD